MLANDTFIGICIAVIFIVLLFAGILSIASHENHIAIYEVQAIIEYPDNRFDMIVQRPHKSQDKPERQLMFTNKYTANQVKVGNTYFFFRRNENQIYLIDDVK